MGVQLINLGKRDAVVGMARNAEAEDEEAAEDEAGTAETDATEAVEGTETVAGEEAQA